MTEALPPEERKNDPWPEEKVALLLKHAKDGRSASEIAERLNDGTTRNAVIGKLMRLERSGLVIERRGALLKQGSAPARGMSARPKPSMPTVAKAAAKSPVAIGGTPFNQRGRAFRNPLRAAQSKPLKLEPPVPFTNGGRITILELSSKTCKWPIGDPQHKDFCFCGHPPRAESSYCTYHARAAYQPAQPRGSAAKLPPLPLPNFSGLSK